MKNNTVRRLMQQLDKRPYTIILLVLAVFSSYRILRNSVIKETYTASINFGFPVLFFALSLAALPAAYVYSRRLGDRGRLAALFLTSMMMMLSVSVFTTLGDYGRWLDASSYYNLGVLASESGQLGLIGDYNSIVYGIFQERYNESFNGSLTYETNPFFSPTSGIVGFSKDVVLSLTDVKSLASGVPPDVSLFSAARVNPPLWPLIISVFITLLGAYPASALLAEWVFASLVPVVLYLWLRIFSGRDNSLRLSLLFIFVPSFLIWTSQPLIDAPLAFFLTSSSYFYVRALREKRYEWSFASGVLLSACFLMKFAPLIMFLPFLILAIAGRDRRSSIKLYGAFAASSVILPLAMLALNYSMPLQLVMAKISQEITISGYVQADFFTVFVVPLYLLTYFGIPLIFLIATGFLRMLSDRRTDSMGMMSLAFLFTLFLMWLVIFGSGLDRHMLPFLPLLLPLAASEMKRRSLGDMFLFFSAAVCIAQFILFL